MAVLVVEDEILVLMLAQSILREAGYETLPATDQAEASAVLRSGARVDVLCTDIRLKKIRDSGLALAQRAALDYPSIRVVYTSGQLITDAMRSRFVWNSVFVPKPYRAAQLLAAVKHAITAAA